MGRKTRISREMILDAAYEILDESGINAVAIKSIAARLECSTQPISWHFGSMTELRRELFVFTADRVWGGIASEMADMDAVEAFFETGKRYISLACDHPNVFRYLCVDESTQAFSKGGQEDRSIFSFQFDPVAVEMLSKQYDVPVEKIGRAVQDTVIYTHGLAVMMMRDNFRMPKEDACGMIYDMGVKMLKDIGISIS